uniref:Pleckstrin homology-like domain family A member 2 n=1 Tax=Ficedula albicollis TaxID=59894 RepID=U3KJ56_FICAL
GGEGSGQTALGGELEKRSDSLFQLWKKKLVVLTKDSLSLFPDGHKRAKGKELGFGSILKVDCVERTGKYIYFTIVTKDRKEIDFRCPDQSCWNASITMALIDFQNKRAIQDFKSRQEMEQAAGTQERRLFGQPDGREGPARPRGMHGHPRHRAPIPRSAARPAHGALGERCSGFGERCPAPSHRTGLSGSAALISGSAALPRAIARGSRGALL